MTSDKIISSYIMRCIKALGWPYQHVVLHTMWYRQTGMCVHSFCVKDNLCISYTLLPPSLKVHGVVSVWKTITEVNQRTPSLSPGPGDSLVVFHLASDFVFRKARFTVGPRYSAVRLLVKSRGTNALRRLKNTQIDYLFSQICTGHSLWSLLSLILICKIFWDVRLYYQIYTFLYRIYVHCKILTILMWF